MTRSYYLFTDIHGCLEEFQELYRQVDPAETDVIVLNGDLLDKGPDSAGVVKYARELQARHEVVLISGNHEYKHFRYRKHLENGRSAAKKMAESNSELAEITNALSAHDTDWLDSAQLYYKIPDTHYIVLHAGVPGQMKSIPPTPFMRDKYDSLLMYTRFTDSAGRMKHADDVQETDTFWATKYDGRFGHVLFGHEPFTGRKTPTPYPNATGFDLGCVFGGHLCCVKVTPGSDLQSFVVPAKRQYAPVYRSKE